MEGTVTIDLIAYNKMLLAYKSMEKVESFISFELEEAAKRNIEDAKDGTYPCASCYVSAEKICSLMNLSHYETFEALRKNALKIYNDVKDQEVAE